jgi:DNA-directed RNA polymerase II subunit RPB2
MSDAPYARSVCRMHPAWSPSALPARASSSVLSFDEFIQNKMQEVVDEQLPIEVIPEPAVPEDHPDYRRTKHRFKFGQIYLSTASMTEKDGTIDTMRPMVARLRNLTYCAPLFADISKQVFELMDDGTEKLLENENERMLIGKIPIMLRSKYCVLNGENNKGITDMGEVSREARRGSKWKTPTARTQKWNHASSSVTTE